MTRKSINIMQPSLKPRHRYRQNEDDRVLPLVNVVFLLLIFFMIAGQMVQPEKFNVAPPLSEAEGIDRIRTSTVEISVSGEIAFEGTRVSDDELRRLIANKAQEKATPPLRVKADGAAEAVRVIEVMALLRDAGIKCVELVARQAPQ